MEAHWQMCELYCFCLISAQEQAYAVGALKSDEGSQVTYSSAAVAADCCCLCWRSSAEGSIK